jgi:hypothetical protein
MFFWCVYVAWSTSTQLVCVVTTVGPARRMSTQLVCVAATVGPARLGACLHTLYVWSQQLDRLG